MAASVHFLVCLVHTVLRALVALCLAAGGVAQAATYSVSAAAGNATSFPWIDSVTGGTSIALADNAVSGTLAIPFTFMLGSAAHTGLRVMSNGQVQFVGNDSSAVNSAMPLDGSSGKPNIDAVLLALWDDLAPNLGGSVTYKTTGTAPNQVFTVSWTAVPYAGASSNTATFQVQLHEQGWIVYRYGAVNGNGGTHTGTGTFTNPAGATVGLELSNSDFVQFSRNTASVASGTTLVWSPASTATLLASYAFAETVYTGAAGEWKDTGGHISGPFNGNAQGSPLPSTTNTSPARSGSGNRGTCAYATFPGPTANGGDFVASGLPVSSAAGAKTSVAFWMYWDGTDQVATVGWNNYGVALGVGWLGFSTGNNDIWGASNAGLANGWHHVVAVFTNGSVSANQLFVDGVAVAGAQRVGVPVLGNAVVTNTFNVGGHSASTGFRFRGRIDEVRVFNGALNAGEVNALYVQTQSCPAVLMARYNFDEYAYSGAAGELKDTAGYTGGPFNGKAQGSPLPTPASATPARSGSPGTCGYASLPGPTNNGGGFIISGLPVDTSDGAKTSVAFWMYWNGTSGVMPIGWQIHDLYLLGTAFGFNTGNSEAYGIANTGLANTWKHVVAVFTNKSVTSNKIYIDGVDMGALTYRAGSSSNLPSAVVVNTLRIGGWGSGTTYRMAGRIDQVQVYNGELTPAEVASVYAETATCPPPALHHLEIQHASGTGLTCTPSTVTVKACLDAACSTPFTGGVSGTLSATGGSVVWPAGTSFNIAAGSSTTTVNLQATTTTATVLGVASSTPSASNATSCNFGTPACTFTAADAGLLFDVVNHVSEVQQSVSVSAVKKSDNSLACTPAFTSVSRNVTFSCAYTNPSTGTLPVRVGGAALNAAGNSAAACDAGGKAVALAFNASGVATTTVQYADVGQLNLSATYTGSAGTNDTGLVMTGSDSFIAAPDHFAITNVTAGPIKAGNSFSATVAARNASGATTPNYGRETVAQGIVLGWVRLQPTGTGAANGNFSGSAGSFSNGAVTVANLAWTEVGRGDLVARGADATGYSGSGMHVFGSSTATGARHCAAEGSNCVLPGGTATVYYGAISGWAAKTGQTGTVSCSSANFGDPAPGLSKRCFYVTTAATNGSVGDFIPHHFSVAATAACSSFSYAGQPFASTVTALNLAGNTTVNFNGTATTTPSLAQAVTLADATPLGLGTLTGNSLAASAFSQGVATAAPSYAFTSKTTAPQSLVLRASNGGSGAAAVSSQGYTEPSMPLRSGRLRLSNAFGKSTTALQVPVVAEYWSNSAWVLNSADNCTALAGASVALSNPRNASGGASTATSSAGAVAISSGSGSINLAAPSPASSSLSLDIAVNLGSTSADQSCNTTKPSTTGAAKAWLRAQNGNCAATADRDPAARASFGVFAPETRKTVHVRDIF